MKKLLSLILLLSFTIKAHDVTIGTQTWTSKNLNVSKFRNGEAIPLAKTNAEWKSAGENKQPAWCYYENKTANGTKYGKLYNFYAVNDPRGLAPSGYHVPTDAEWTILTDYLGGESKAGKKMKSTIGWKNNCNRNNGTNTSGFAGLPGGSREDHGGFKNEGWDVHAEGLWWSTTYYAGDVPWSRELGFTSDDLSKTAFASEYGLSVRCIKD